MKPVRGEPVSEGEEGVSVTRKEDSGGLWHKLHLHSSTGSRWTDGRIDEQTERGKGETHKHRYCSHSAAAKGRGGCQKMRKHTTSNDPM